MEWSWLFKDDKASDRVTRTSKTLGTSGFPSGGVGIDIISSKCLGIICVWLVMEISIGSVVASQIWFTMDNSGQGQ